MRDEQLNETLLPTLDRVRLAVAEWTENFSATRPHSSPDCESPASVAARFTAKGGHATLLRGSECQAVAQPAQLGIQLAIL